MNSQSRRLRRRLPWFSPYSSRSAGVQRPRATGRCRPMRASGSTLRAAHRSPASRSWCPSSSKAFRSRRGGRSRSSRRSRCPLECRSSRSDAVSLSPSCVRRAARPLPVEAAISGATFRRPPTSASGPRSPAPTCSMPPSRSRASPTRTRQTTPPPARSRSLRRRTAAKPCIVPNVIRMTPPVARRAILRAGCRLGVTRTALSATVRKGLVMRQTPVARKRVAGGTKVTLVVSLGK